MKEIVPQETRTVSDAWGRKITIKCTTYEIEESDIGTSKKSYLGYGCPAKTFSSADVGKGIVVRDDGCWWFRKG